MPRIFPFGIPVSGDLFTDREEETKRLVSNFSYGVNTFILSPRRWGKTSLVQRAIKLAEHKSKKFVYMDIMHCKTRDDFCRTFASAVLKQTAGKMEEIAAWGREFMSHVFLGLTLSPNPDNPFSINLDWRDGRLPEDEIFSLPEKIAKKKGIDIVVCIDEFQQIAEYPDSNSLQARLRGMWQLQEHVSYCLFGSKKHSMEGLFDTTKKPFFKFGDIMYLRTIPLDYWVPFISGKFNGGGKEISEDMCRQICQTVSFNSSYIQQLSWYLFQMTDKKTEQTTFVRATEELITRCSDVFEARTHDLTAYQMRFLIAMADGITEGFSSAHTISKYKLGSSANVAAIRQALLEKGLIETTGNTIIMSDPVMALWIKARY